MTSLTQSLTNVIISRDDQPKLGTECTSAEKTKAFLVITQKGYSRSLMWKKQTYNCALTLQDLRI